MICDQGVIRVQKSIGSEVWRGGACGTLLAHGLIQNISLRGHRADGKLGEGVIAPVNDGNYRHSLRFRIASGIASGDEALKRAMSATAANAKYTSTIVQNELLAVMARMVKESITARVQQAQFWSILADESTDRSTRKQMVFVARYVNAVKDVHVIREDPFSVVDVFAEIEDMKSNKNSAA